MVDQVANFKKVTVSTEYNNTATSIVLATGQGAELPDPSGDNYNVVWWDSTNYNDPADDPNVEIVRVTAKTTDTLTVTRNQEGSGASNKNNADATYKMILATTAKTTTDLIPEHAATVIVGKSGNVDYLTTDYGSDDACIQAAIDYVSGLGGGNVLIREGTYITTSTITITGINVTIEFLNGAKFNNTQNDYALSITHTVRGYRYINILNPHIYTDSGTYATSKGIYINKASGIIIDNVYMDEMLEGINVSESNSHVFTNGIIYGQAKGTGNGIYLSDKNVAHVKIESVTVSRFENGIYSVDPTNYKNEAAKITACNLVNSTNGIQIVNGRSWTIEKCYFETCDKGIYINSTGTGPASRIVSMHNYYTLAAATYDIYIADYGTKISCIRDDEHSAGTHFYKGSHLVDFIYIPFAAVGNFTAPSVPATTVNYRNMYGYPCQVQVYGGTVTEIDIDDIATGLTSGMFIIPPSGTINITYSAAPSWRWWGL